ncbi:MAG: hypothetical protein CNE97_04875 [alpha proteobacterium MED-G10]|nr:MAG: hypothetical protein CNE97_04875 [alpha proteobacterium MED-G10]
MENYSIQAKNLLESIILDYELVLKTIHQDDFYLKEIKKIRITINSRIRKISDLAEIKNNYNDSFFLLVIFNEDYFSLLNEELEKLDLKITKDGQFIKIDKKKLSYNQVMTLVDDIEKIKNKTLTKCTKAKSEPVIRARTALENDFIDPIVSRETSNKCEKLLESTGLKIEEITKRKIKDILGTEYFKKYQNESI